jgi:hypothetical protein
MGPVKNSISKRWPLYEGGFGGRGRMRKRYMHPNARGVPMTIEYNPPHHGLNNNKIVRNIKNLKTGTVYLFVIQVDRDGNYETRFVETEGHVEISARHAYLANLSNVHSKIVIASGEIKVLPSGRIMFNLESGTFMRPLKQWYKGTLSKNLTNEEKNQKFNHHYPNFVRNIFKVPNAVFTKNILISKESLPLNEIKRRASVTPGIKISGYVAKRGLPHLSFNNWVTEMSGRKTRSKGPVRSNMMIR